MLDAPHRHDRSRTKEVKVGEVESSRSSLQSQTTFRRRVPGACVSFCCALGSSRSEVASKLALSLTEGASMRSHLYRNGLCCNLELQMERPSRTLLLCRLRPVSASRLQSLYRSCWDFSDAYWTMDDYGHGVNRGSMLEVIRGPAQSSQVPGLFRQRPILWSRRAITWATK